MTAGTQVIGLYLIGAARNYSWSNGSAPLFMNGMTNCIKKKRKKQSARSRARPDRASGAAF